MKPEYKKRMLVRIVERGILGRALRNLSILKDLRRLAFISHSHLFIPLRVGISPRPDKHLLDRAEARLQDMLRKWYM